MATINITVTTALTLELAFLPCHCRTAGGLCTHIYTHTYTHTYMFYTHTYIHTWLCSFMRTHKRINYGNNGKATWICAWEMWDELLQGYFLEYNDGVAATRCTASALSSRTAAGNYCLGKEAAHLWVVVVVCTRIGAVFAYCCIWTYNVAVDMWLRVSSVAESSCSQNIGT